MENYLWKLEFPSRYFLKEEKEDEKIIRYYIDYPSSNDDDDLNWSFFTTESTYGSECKCIDWNIPVHEQEEIKDYIRRVIRPTDYNEYNFMNYVPGKVRVKSFEVDGGYVDYYVDYPSEGEVKDWSFYIGSDNKNTNGEFKIEPWNISELETEYLKDYIRYELAPKDMSIKGKYRWDRNTDSSYVLEMIQRKNCREWYTVEYPIKGDNTWHFLLTIYDVNGEYVIDSEAWELSEGEENEIKDYIRNVLKPDNFFEESEEKEMDKDFENRLVFDIPKERHEDVKRIVEAFINNEDEYMVDDMLVDEYLDAIKQRDDYESRMKQASEKLAQLQEQINNMPGDQNPLDVAEIERLKDENRMLRSELAAISEKNEGKSILEMPLSEVLAIIDNMRKGIGYKVIVCKEN